jgi:hypothetical protein
LPYFLLAGWMVASPGVSSHSLFSSIAASTRLAAKMMLGISEKSRYRTFSAFVAKWEKVEK